jgi:hypothetical protein
VCAVPEQPAAVTAMAAERARAKDLFITEFENLIKIASFLCAAGIYMGRQREFFLCAAQISPVRGANPFCVLLRLVRGEGADPFCVLFRLVR